ncbi:MAG: choice-of-anchor L domain-containing protein [Bacteroidota bacterium]
MKIIIYILFLVPSVLFGQLTTNVGMSPPALIQNVLLGTGVVISNVSYTGNPTAIAEFTAGATSVSGMTHGIVLTTGTVLNNGDGPQGPNNKDNSGFDNGANGSTLLDNVAGSGTFNATILEFDFVAAGDLVSFNYVFGSEEYPEFVNAGFNDVFGLFISGPGITGNQNIAKLPNGTPVTIDNVNAGANSSFFVNNGDGSQSPFNSSSTFIQYDGYTRKLTASAPVQCGGTYHLTIAIADVGDAIYDSGIFLEAESLTSVAPTNIDFQISQNFFGDPSIIAEGCTSADFTFSRTNTTDAMSVPIVLSGTAQNGLDYTNTIPGNLNLAVGQSSASFTFDAIVDGIVEGLESIIITFQVPDLCGGVIDQSFTLQIQEVEPISVVLENDTIFCDGAQTITLTPIITGGLEPITYQWSTSQITPTITVSPTITTTFSVTATDFCLNSNDTDDAEIFIPPLIPITIQPIPDITEECPFVLHNIIPNVSGGAGSQYNFLWKQNFQPIGVNSSINITPRSTAIYQLIVSDNCGAIDSIDFTYFVTTQVLVPEINTPAIICPGETVLLSASATLGLGQYSYAWVHSGETTSDVFVSPNVSTTFTVNISDECQTYSVPIQTTVPVHEPFANFSFSSGDLQVGTPIQFQDLSTNPVSFIWDFGNGFTSINQNPTTVYSDIGTYDISLIIIDNFGCIDTVVKEINIGYTLYIPNTFTPDGNRFNGKFKAKSLNIHIISMEIFNRWGELVFESQNDTDFEWDGTYKNKLCPDGVYTYKIRYRTFSSREEFDKTGHVNLLR